MATLINDKERNYLFDNLRAVAIFLVVFGHMLETFWSPVKDSLYQWIYSFHIPLLVFMSGYFAKFDLKKIAIKLLLPLLTFQGLYCAFDYALYQNTLWQYLFAPYWLLWYIASLIFWRLSVFFLQKIKPIAVKIAVVVGLVVIGLGVGFCPYINRVFSLSRTFVFSPFFVVGYFIKETNFPFKTTQKTPKIILICVFLAVFLAISASILYFKVFPYELLYGASSYHSTTQNLLDGMFKRLVLYVVAAAMIFLLATLLPNKKIQVFSTVSLYSMQIYLWHGFVVMALKKLRWISDSNWSVLIAFALSIAIVGVISTIFYLIDRIKLKNKQIKNSL